MARIELLSDSSVVEESITTTSYLLVYQEGDKLRVKGNLDPVTLLTQERVIALLGHPRLQAVIPLVLRVLRQS